MLQKIKELAGKASEARWKYLYHHDEEDSGADSSSDDSGLLITPPSPISPILSSDLESNASDDSTTSVELRDAHYRHFLQAICALYDEVKRARVINPIAEQPMHAPELHLLEYFVDDRPHLF